MQHVTCSRNVKSWQPNMLPLTLVQLLQYEYIVRNRTASKKVIGSEANAGDLLPSIRLECTTCTWNEVGRHKIGLAYDHSAIRPKMATKIHISNHVNRLLFKFSHSAKTKEGRIRTSLFRDVCCLDINIRTWSVHFGDTHRSNCFFLYISIMSNVFIIRTIGKVEMHRNCGKQRQIEHQEQARTHTYILV